MNIHEQRSRNIARTWLLILGFLLFVLAIGYAVSWYYGDPSLLVIAFCIALFTNLYAYWGSDKLVLSLSHARPATRDEFFDFYTVTENLSIAAGLPMPKLYVIDDPAPNAFATGRDEKHAVVCATTGLLALLTRAELEGVIGHELSHIKNRDILVMTVAVVLAGFIAILADIFLRMSYWGGKRDNRAGGLLMVLAIVGIILAPFAAQLIQLAISRRREFLADASGAYLTRYPEGLASALQKISSANRPMRHASHATAHLFIDEPFGRPEGGTMAWIERLFSTHPPVQERISVLLGEGQK
jgi:heat shock protein HtpX